MALAVKDFPFKEVVGAVFIALILGGWALKENVSDHSADVAKLRSETARSFDSVRFERNRGQDSVMYRLQGIENLLQRELCSHHRRPGC